MNKFLVLALALLVMPPSFAGGNPAMTVYKRPTCGCCDGWIAYMRGNGFKIKTVDMEDVAPIKKRYAVPEYMSSCHTAVIESTGQVIEGHVPVTAVRKMLANKQIKGIAAPGMPHNSPGMGLMDGNLVTYEFSGAKFSRD